MGRKNNAGVGLAETKKRKEGTKMSRRDKRFHLRLQPGEKEQILKRIKLTGCGNMSAYARKVAIDGPIIKLDLSPLKEIGTKLKVLSDITNQCTKRANENGQIYEEDIKDIKERQAEILEDMKKFEEYLEPLSKHFK